MFQVISRNYGEREQVVSVPTLVEAMDLCNKLGLRGRYAYVSAGERVLLDNEKLADHYHALNSGAI